jgi:hypothetical protein
MSATTPAATQNRRKAMHLHVNARRADVYFGAVFIWEELAWGVRVSR